MKQKKTKKAEECPSVCYKSSKGRKRKKKTDFFSGF